MSCKGAVIGVTRKKWQQYGLPHVVEVEHHPDLFVISLAYDEQAIFAWDKQPYTISGSLMAVKHWDGNGRADQVCFNNISMWVHMFDIPLAYQDGGKTHKNH
ncbi:hypothetical protein LINGRAHAP2_LOCUS34411 [Linum grandiflorum]